MATVNISLVGKQPYPVLAQLLDARPERAVLVCSAETEAVARRVAEVASRRLAVGVAVQAIDTTRPAAIAAAVRAIADVNCREGDAVTVNLVGGTKLWSLLFYRTFAGRARCVLIDQNNEVTDLDTLESHRFDPAAITIDDVMSLAGVRVLQKKALAEFTDDDLALIPVIERLRMANYAAFNELTMDPPQPEKTSRDGRGVLRWDKEARAFDIELADRRGTLSRERLASPNVRRLLLNHGWFECKVAHLLAGWSQAARVWTGVTVAGPDSARPLNEFDIVIATTAGKWVFVECKTQVYKPTDVDKFSEVARRYGGMGCKVAFITAAPMESAAAEKCRQARIPYYDMATIAATPAATREFFGELDRYMGSINA